VVSIAMPAPTRPVTTRIPPATSGVRVDVIKLGKTIHGGRTTLLDDISLSIQPSELVAIVGGSGAGKSTLLDALSGTRPATAGRVLLNGVDLYDHLADFAGQISYVPQDDIIHQQLTVEAALYYTARIRLPPELTEEQIRDRIDDVLDEVALRDRRAVVISALSGGQRKRACIAAELLIRPRLLFLDEPTSGLDPGLDLRLMLLLRQLADEGRTVIYTTHATSNIMLADKIIFLGRDGRLVFFGAPGDALRFFGVERFSEIYALLEERPASAAEWQARFRDAAHSWHFAGERVEPIAPDAAVAANGARAPRSDATHGDASTGWQQFGILTRRYVRLLWSDKATLAFLIGQAPFIGLCLGLVSGANIFETGMSFATAQVALVLMMVMNLWIGANTASREIVKERAIYRRERLVTLRIAPYVLSKVVVLSALNLLQTVLFVGVMVLYTGVPESGVFMPALPELMLTIWITGIAGSAMGLFISAVSRNLDLALSLTPTSIIPQMLMCGALLALPSSVSPVSYATIGKYAVNSLGTTADLNHMYYATAGQLPADDRVAGLLDAIVFDPTNYDDDPRPAKTAAESERSRATNLLRNWAVLGGWVVLFVGLACVALKQKDRAWRR
jgi:ABC-type multidrug transport system ATPase subunit